MIEDVITRRVQRALTRGLRRWITACRAYLLRFSHGATRQKPPIPEVRMSGKPFFLVVVVSLTALLLPQKSGASEHPSLISQGPYISPAVHDMPPQAGGSKSPEEISRRHPPAHPGSVDVVDPVVQTSTTTAAAAQTLAQWEGLGAGYPGYAVTAVPPDPNMAVGPNRIVQWVNNAFVVFDKSGRQINAPVSDSTFWGLSACNQLGGFSDPIVQYDSAADRWLVGEVALPLLPPLLGQFAQCFAVSTTSDPAGSYYMWAYGFGTSIPDYPKIGLWPDGYYVTWNIFQNGTTFSGAEACAWDRIAMTHGVAAPPVVCFQLTSAFASLLPSDLDGAIAPPAGSPNFLMNVDTATGELDLWKFHVDFANPRNSTFLGPISIPGVAPFTAPCPDIQDCIPQPATTTRLDALGDRLMYRLAYRNFGDHESIVANHAVVASTGATGVRWYEIRSPNASPAIYQQGTFAPDTDNRWMASIAMDHSGNIGVGYSVSSAGTFPSIRYTGWEVGNPLGALQNETFLVVGGGSQTGYNRWGDYAAMRIDPSDDCLLWFTEEYQAVTEVANWNTRIASFRFPSCGQSQASTTTTLASSSPTSTVGQPVTFTAAVAPSAATGSVQFFDGVNSLGTAVLSGGNASLTTATLAAGTHSITATYGGDSSYASSTSSALTQTVLEGVVNTTTAVTSSLNPSAYGDQVTFTATVSPSSGATGTVTFMDGGSAIGSSLLNATGVATFSTSSLAVGSHSITAQYGGDNNHNGSTSPVLSQTVNKAITTTRVTSDANPSKSGRTVTFTATVSPSSATGTVQFFDGLTSLGTATLNSGSASLSTSTLTIGKHSITATYGGDANFAGSNSAVLAQNVTGKK
jgi:hypothetical protein